MKVIVAGYPKTGTKSMNAALTQLGYSVYDVFENFILLGDEYRKIFLEGWTTEDFRGMYENIDAIMDIPACLFWDEIHKAFPDAKIILTLRDDEDVWCRSLFTQMNVEKGFFLHLLTYLSPSLRKVRAEIFDPTWYLTIGQRRAVSWSRKVVLNEELAKKKYRSHNAYVMHTAPKDKLLVFKCSEGWEPLCKFLDVPVPDVPFPRKNVRGNYLNDLGENQVFRRIQKEIAVSLIAIAVGTGILAYCSMKYGPKTIALSASNHAKTLLSKLTSSIF